MAVFVHLRELKPQTPPGHDEFFEIIPPIAIQALDIALTAIASGKTVAAKVGDPYIDGEKNELGTSYCYSLTMNAE